MHLNTLLDQSLAATAPPPGLKNVRIGAAIEGPGGRWIPCASQTPGGAFVSCVYRVGPGQRQVCDASAQTHCLEEALSRAVVLASTAAA